MKIKVVEDYKDNQLNEEKKVGDVYEVSEKRGKQILATGWAVEIVEEETEDATEDATEETEGNVEVPFDDLPEEETEEAKDVEVVEDKPVKTTTRRKTKKEGK